MLNLLLYLWVICVAFGPAYNVVGDPGVFALMIAIVILSRKISLDRKHITSTIAFAALLAYKSIGINNSQAIAVFHSAFGVINTGMKLIAFTIFLQVLFQVAGENKEKVIKLFVWLYHISVAISIVLLFVLGRNTYRDDVAAGGILLAPQIYITISVFVIMALVYILIHTGEKKAIRFILIGLNFIYIFMSNYTTQLIFVVIGILVVITVGSKMKKSNKVILIGIVGLLIVIGIPMLPNIIDTINKTIFATNETVNTRLNEIVLLLRRESIRGSDLMGRFDRITLSWNTFMTGPILGIPFSRYNTVSTGIVVGGHSEWPDDLARFGIVGGFIFGLFVIRLLKKCLDYDHEENKPFKKAVIVIVLLYGFSNPIIRYMEFEFFFLIWLFVDCSVKTRGGSRNIWTSEKNRRLV